MATKIDSVLDEAAIQDFRTGLRGALLGPGDEGYEATRRVWNGMLDRRPALIVRCAGVADITNAVNFARTNNLLVAVRGGGHNMAGNAVCDGGLMIDLSPLKGIQVDPVRRTVRAQAGVTCTHGAAGGSAQGGHALGAVHYGAHDQARRHR